MGCMNLLSILEIMALSSNHVSNSIGKKFNPLSNDDEMIHETNMDRQKCHAFACVVVIANSIDMFNANELEYVMG